jgi:hypothetical protein
MKKSATTAIAVAVMFPTVTPALAKSTLGGIVFTDFYVLSQDKESRVDSTGNPNAESRTVSHVEVPNMTRLRTRWSNEDKVGMYTELGLGGSQGSTGVKLRHAYGTWDISQTWQLMGGHSTSPFSPLFPSQTIGNNADESFNIGKGYGEISSGRAPQMRLTYKFLNQRGAFAIALLDPNRGTELDLLSTTDKAEKNTIFPRVDIGMAYRTFNFQIFPSFFYQKQDYSEVVGSDDSVTSWGTSLGFRAGKGAFIFSGEVNVGQNMGNAGLSIGDSPASKNAGAWLDVTRKKIGDTNNLSYWLDMGYKFSSSETQSTVHLIYGTMQSESDKFDYQTSMLGISVPIELPWIAKGFRVRPEIFVYDKGDNSIGGTEVDQGRDILGGVQLQYTF